MKLSESELRQLHKASFRNESRVKKSELVSCFDCAQIFSASLVTWWVDDDPERTAMCPLCETDAILPDDEEILITHDLLQQMNKRWFSGLDKEYLLPK